MVRESRSQVQGWRSTFETDCRCYLCWRTGGRCKASAEEGEWISSKLTDRFILTLFSRLALSWLQRSPNLLRRLPRLSKTIRRQVLSRRVAASEASSPLDSTTNSARTAVSRAAGLEIVAQFLPSGNLLPNQSFVPLILGFSTPLIVVSTITDAQG